MKGGKKRHFQKGQLGGVWGVRHEWQGGRGGDWKNHRWGGGGKWGGGVLPSTLKKKSTGGEKCRGRIIMASECKGALKEDGGVEAKAVRAEK